MSRIDRILAGDEAAVCLRGEVESSDRSAVKALMPGAFNPLHEGHARMTDVAVQLLAQEVEFEISVSNVDKGELSSSAIRHRLKQFGVSQPVWITRAPTFVEKSILFPAATFVVGVDTIQRIADSTYYEGRQVDRDQALLAISEHN